VECFVGGEAKNQFLEIVSSPVRFNRVRNFSPGKVADPVKVVFLKPLGVRYSFSLLTVVWERIFDLFLLFSASLLVLSAVSAQLAFGAFGAAVVLALAGLVVHKKLGAAIGFFSRFKVFSFLKRVEVHKFKKKTLAIALVLSFVIWGIDFLATWLAFNAVGVALDYFFLAGAASAAIVVGVFTFLPAGLGSTEVSLLFLLSLLRLPAGAADGRNCFGAGGHARVFIARGPCDAFVY